MRKNIRYYQPNEIVRRSGFLFLPHSVLDPKTNIWEERCLEWAEWEEQYCCSYQDNEWKIIRWINS